ncbi:hypothetical protein AYO38_06160 [bacterium SCGC AG-212-C10]|nr:hypothetical protein AYO38_06160 [bacterium SCGC AG-212-C10]
MGVKVETRRAVTVPIVGVRVAICWTGSVETTVETGSVARGRAAAEGAGASVLNVSVAAAVDFGSGAVVAVRVEVALGQT